MDSAFRAPSLTSTNLLMNYLGFLDELQNLSKIPKYTHKIEEGNLSTQTRKINVNVDSPGDLVNRALKCLEADETYCRLGLIDNVQQLVNEIYGCKNNCYIVQHSSGVSNVNDSEIQLIDLIEKFEQSNLLDHVYLYAETFEEFFNSCHNWEFSPAIGVYFIDTYDYRSTLLSLLLGTKFLASTALIVVNNVTHIAVRQASWDFINTSCCCELLADVYLSVRENSLNNNFGGNLYLFSWNTQRETCYSLETINQHFKNQVFVESFRQISQEFEEFENLNFLENLKRKALEKQVFKNYDEAIEAYQQVLYWVRYDADVWHNLAVTYYLKDCPEFALDAIKQAMALNPDSLNYRYTLGFIFENTGDSEQAVQIYRTIIQQEPTHINAYMQLANLYVQHGRVDDAIDLCKQAIEANSESYLAYAKLGVLFMEQGEYEQAKLCCSRSLKIHPNNAGLLKRLGKMCEVLGQQLEAYQNFALSAYYKKEYDHAIQYCNLYLELNDRDPKIYIILANSYLFVNAFENAYRMCQLAIEQFPLEPKIYGTVALAYNRIGLNEELVKLKEKANLNLSDNLEKKLATQLRLIDFLPLIYNSHAEIEYYRKDVVNTISQIEQSLEFIEPLQVASEGLKYATNRNLFYQGKNDLELQQRRGTFTHKFMAKLYPEWVKPIVMPEPTATGKIKIGYISHCMFGHTVGRMTLGWLQNHDRRTFEVYSYYVDHQVDIITQRFKIYSDYFYHIPANLEKIAHQILANKLHLLVFLDMGITPITIQLGSLRLAPIQCKFWGPPVTSGLPTIDYFLSSDLMEAEGADRYYSEQLIRLPNIAVSYPQPSTQSLQKTRRDYGFDDGKIIYISCQSLPKYLPQYDYIFPAIAAQIKHAQFVFIQPNRGSKSGETFALRLAKKFRELNLVFENYCIMLPWFDDSNEFLNLNRVCDIFLDTFAWSGGKTTLDALALNLPVVTCPGEFLRGRHAYGILKMLGVTETIAQTESDYIEIAVRLGLDPQWRTEIIEKIQQRQHRLFDDQACIKGLEAFYKTVVSAG